MRLTTLRRDGAEPAALVRPGGAVLLSAVDDAVADAGRLDGLAIPEQELHNGQVHRRDVVSNITFRPWWPVPFHSGVMTLPPGDIISTGTPGAVHIRPGDTAGCHIDGFRGLTNPVVSGRPERGRPTSSSVPLAHL